jgi:hypothetical protein
VYAALSYLFSEDQEKYEDTDSSLPLHSTIDIICSAQEVSNEVETDDSRKVYVASRTDGLAGVDYSVDEILKFQEEDPDLELVIPFLRTNQNLLEEKLFISSKAAKKIWLNKDMFFLDGTFPRSREIIGWWYQGNWSKRCYQCVTTCQRLDIKGRLELMRE